MRIPTHDEIRDAYHQREEAIIQLFDRTFQDFQEILPELQAELQALKGQLNKNSKNRRKPHLAMGSRSHALKV